MAKLLCIQASPRDGRSHSIQAADAFLDAYCRKNPGDEVQTIELFRKDLPAFDGAALDAKYAIMHGQKPSPGQVAAWRVVEGIIEEFTSADKYLLAVPMWNFGIPYRLKQYIDVIVQPAYTFSVSPQGAYAGLVTGRPVAIVYARGGDYREADPGQIDFQKRYLELILGFIGLTDIHSIVIEPTLMGGPDVAKERTQAGIVAARELAERF